MKPIDLSTLTFEQWEVFFFGPLSGAKESNPYKGIEFVDAPADLVQLTLHITETCNTLDSIIARHRPSWQHVDCAMWKIMGLTYDHGIDHIWNPVVPFMYRVNCIKSMYFIFKNVVAKIPADVDMETCFYMWWDVVCFGFCHAHGHKSRDEFRPESATIKKLHDVMFETLAKIYKLGEWRCQQSALHGLGHLNHRKVRSFVQKIVHEARLEDWHDDTIAWLEQCRDGTVM